MCAAPLSPVATTGYNQDIIVENGTTAQAGSFYIPYVTATMDDAANPSGTTYYERGLDTSAPDTGLPTNNLPFTSADLANVSFQLQPYTQNNALLVSNGQTGTLTLATPLTLSNIAFLFATGGSGSPGTDAITLHFSDGTPNYTALSLVSPSWFSSSSAAYTSMGRVDVPSGNFFNVGEANPRLYDQSFDLAALGLSGHAISSVDFAFSGNGYSAMFAVSGSVVPEPSSGQLALVCLAAAMSVAGLRTWKKRSLRG
ncbi:MAG: hypothetical protein INR62_01170 [Rhodospirillales bacterium]|nr:hypothetical protein [Acetobacter sp.]